MVCINLSKRLAYMIQEVRPRTSLQKRSAQQSVPIHLAVWAVCLAGLLWIVLVGAI